MAERRKLFLRISDGSILREWEAEHAQNLYGFINACWRTMKLQGADWAEALTSPKEIRERIETLDPSRERRFGLWDQGLLVGVVRVIAMGNQTIQIDFLVNPVFSERDHMIFAIKQLAKAYFAKGRITTCVAFVLKNNLRALHTLDQAGFAQVATDGDRCTFVLKKWEPFFLNTFAHTGSVTSFKQWCEVVKRCSGGLEALKGLKCHRDTKKEGPFEFGITSDYGMQPTLVKWADRHGIDLAVPDFSTERSGHVRTK